MFWEMLISICNDNNTTPTATVKALGISLGSVTKWKKGAQPNSTTIKKIADYFNVSVAYLKGETEQKENPLAQFSPETVALVERISKLSPDMAKKALEYIDFIAQKK